VHQNGAKKSLPRVITESCQKGAQKAKNCGNKSLPEWGKQKYPNESIGKNGPQKCPPKVFAQKSRYT
jgi:hypothetical protein